MKQIVQNLKSGETVLEDIPSPVVRPGHLLIQTTCSLVSLGTERMLVEFGKANLIDKARQQPEKVKQVLDKVRSDGLMPTIDAVRNKLGQPLPLGYCNVGKVTEVGGRRSEVGKGQRSEVGGQGKDRDQRSEVGGPRAGGFRIGDRVVSNGPHAEIVCVPKNLCARIPHGVEDEEAAFTVMGAIALQGVRLLNPSLGETVVVTGLGLIGLLTAQLLLASGCKVIGIDLDKTKLGLAEKWGVTTISPSAGTDPVKFVEDFTSGVGVDGVIITATTKSKEVIPQSARMCRKRGRIVLVGVVGMEINRADFYEKELSFQVSCSYGPGRYDPEYEIKGHDYPIGFVRWTEKRNFEAVLDMLASGRLDVKSLITHRFQFDEAEKAYELIGGNEEAYVGIILDYNPQITQITQKEKDELATDERRLTQISENTIRVHPRASAAGSGVTFGIIGAGNFTSATVLPILKRLGVQPRYIASAGGLSAKTMASKAGAAYATSDYRQVLEDEGIDLVIITTRHNLHGPMVIEALKAGKNVFVEKPLCLTMDELEEIRGQWSEVSGLLMVGFNRRFAPMARRMKELLGNGAINIVATMNAGYIPPESWVQDMEEGGGRIIGEACHYIDLCTYFAGSRVEAVCMNALGDSPAENTENATILLRYENGSNGVINYFANGNKGYSKERVEVHSQGRTLVMDNWRRLRGYGFKGFKQMKSRQDKGHYEQFRILIKRVKNGGPALIPFGEIVNTTRASLAAIESLKEGRWVEVKDRCQKSEVRSQRSEDEKKEC